jgi:hypothetical protein
MSAASLANWQRERDELRRSILAGNRPVFVARAVRDGDFWYIEVDGVPKWGDAPGAFTQARTVDEIELMARDVTAITLDVPHDSFDLLIETVGDGPA